MERVWKSRCVWNTEGGGLFCSTALYCLVQVLVGCDVGQVCSESVPLPLSPFPIPVAWVRGYAGTYVPGLLHVKIVGEKQRLTGRSRYDMSAYAGQVWRCRTRDEQCARVWAEALGD
jgi:hypothetical protein